MYGSYTRYLLEQARWRAEEERRQKALVEEIKEKLDQLPLVPPDVLAEDAAVAAKHKAENDAVIERIISRVFDDPDRPSTDAERKAMEELTARAFERQQEENSERADGGDE